MEGIIALVLCGSIFRTPGTWAVTRGVALLDVVVAIFYGYTPLRPHLGALWLGMLILTLVIWVVNLSRPSQAAKDK